MAKGDNNFVKFAAKKPAAPAIPQRKSSRLRGIDPAPIEIDNEDMIKKGEVGKMGNTMTNIQTHN